MLIIRKENIEENLPDKFIKIDIFPFYGLLSNFIFLFFFFYLFVLNIYLYLVIFFTVKYIRYIVVHRPCVVILHISVFHYTSFSNNAACA